MLYIVCSLLPLPAGEEDYDAFEEVAGMDPAAVARDLEEASNIKDLENR